MITSPRLLLRPIQPSDAPALFAYRSDAETNQYQGWVPSELSDAEAFIARNPTAFNQPDTWFQLAIELQGTNTMIGDIGIHFIDDEQCELGVTLSKKHHGKGYANEAMQATITHLFGVLNKHRITGSVDPRNAASMNLLEALGFRKEAHFKQSLFFKGEWVDDVVYGLLNSEWKARQHTN